MFTATVRSAEYRIRNVRRRDGAEHGRQVEAIQHGHDVVPGKSDVLQGFRHWGAVLNGHEVSPEPDIFDDP
jgi:hypothetical protein